MANTLLGCLLLYFTHTLAANTVREVSYATCSSTKTDLETSGTYPCQSKIECALMCLDDPDCASASYCSAASGFECRKSSFYTDGSCQGLNPDSGCDQIEVTSPCQNNGSYFPLNGTCDCLLGFVEAYCQRRFRDCIEAPGGGNVKIQPLGSDRIFDIDCGSPATNVTVAWESTQGAAQNFVRTMADYEAGITMNGMQFRFLGLETLHIVTQQGRYDLRVVLFNPIVTPLIVGMVWYTNFKVGSAATGYALSWDNFEPMTGWMQSDDVQDALGGMGDSSKSLQGARFGTFDNDVGGCSVTNDNSGWWYNPIGCGLIQPNAGNPRMTQWPFRDAGVMKPNYVWYTLAGQLRPMYFY